MTEILLLAGLIVVVLYGALVLLVYWTVVR